MRMGDATVYDVIVAGAGPGGSNATAAALAGGLTVAQLDREHFPRVKPCAGGVTMKSLRALRLEHAGLIRASWCAIEFNAWDASTHRFHSVARPVVRMVVRPEFDNALLEQNLRNERLHFVEGERVVDVAYEQSPRERGVFSVRTPQRELRARQLIAADGAYSRVNRIFKTAHPRATATAIEVNVPYDAVLSSAGRPDTCFDFGAVPMGYGWVFPKDNQMSVGLYTYAKGLKDLRERLRAYMRAKGIVISDAAPLRFDAHQVPVGGHRLSPLRMPLYVVGDAGGFADALTGEGIYHALESGRLAGETAVQVANGACAPSQYRRRLWRSVLPDTMLTYHASRHFYRHVGVGIRALALPPVWRAMVEGYADGATVTGTLLRAPWYVARSLAQQTQPALATPAAA